MSETNNGQNDDKRVRVRRQPRPDSVLRPTFTASRQSGPGNQWQERDQPGSLLQRRCACGTHTIGGRECDRCRRQRSEGFLQRAAVNFVPGQDILPQRRSGNGGHDFSRIPASKPDRARRQVGLWGWESKETGTEDRLESAWQWAVDRPNLPSPVDFLASQRTVGNRAVTRLLAQSQGYDEKGDEMEAHPAGRNNQALSEGKTLKGAVPSSGVIQKKDWPMEGGYPKAKTWAEIQAGGYDLPGTLYHARKTSDIKKFRPALDVGLTPITWDATQKQNNPVGVVGEENKFLCVAGKASDAYPIGGLHVVFKFQPSQLSPNTQWWQASGKEWRTADTIPKDKVKFKRRWIKGDKWRPLKKLNEANPSKLVK